MERLAIKEVLMVRDELTEDEADNRIAEARDAFEIALMTGNTDAAEDICYDYFGLEPDYIEEFL